MNGLQSLVPAFKKARKPPKKRVPKYGSGGAPATQYVSNRPAFTEQPLRDVVQTAQDLITQPNVPYGGDRVAQFNDLQEQGFEGVKNLGPSAQSTAAGGMAQTVGDRALGAAAYDPATMSHTLPGGPQQTSTQSFTGAGTADKYMNPYMQSVVDIGKREATRQDDIARTQRNAAAVGAGAFGGSRQAIVEAEAGRNLGQRLSDIQQQGSDAAFKAAQAQFNQEQGLGLESQKANQGAGLQFNQQDLERQKMQEASRQFGADLGIRGLNAANTAASTLGGIGSDIYGQNLKTTGAQLAAGGAEQEQAQRVLDQQYADFKEQEQDPYRRLSFMSDILGGTQGAVKSSFETQPQPSNMQTLAGLGSIFAGLAKAEGGSIPKKSAIDRGLARIAPDSVGEFEDGGIIGYEKGGTTRKEDFMPEEWREGEAGTTAGGIYTGTKATKAALKAAQDARDLAKLAESAGRYGTDVQSTFRAAKPPGTAARVLGRVAAPAVGALSLVDTYNTPTEQYDKRFGLEGREPGFWSDTGVRTLGAASDLGNTLTGGLAGKYLFRDMENEKAPRIPTRAAAAQDGATDLPAIDTTSKASASGGIGGVTGGPRVTAGKPLTMDEMKAARKAAGPSLDDLESKGIKQLEDIGADEKANAEIGARETRERIAKEGIFGEEREKKLQSRTDELPGRERQNEKDAYINAGLAILMAPPGGKGWRGAIAPIAAGAGLGLRGLRAGEKELRAERDKVDDAMLALREARKERESANAKEIAGADEKVRRATTDAKKTVLSFTQAVGMKKTEEANDLFKAWDKNFDNYLTRQLHADTTNSTNATQLGIANARIAASSGSRFAGMKPDQLERAINGEADEIMKANIGMSREEARTVARNIVRRELQGLGPAPASAGWGSMQIGK